MKDKRFTILARIILVLLPFVALAVVGFFAWMILPVSPGVFLSTELITPQVVPSGQSVFSGTGIVEIKSLFKKNDSGYCLVTTEYVLSVADGRQFYVPGIRITNKDSSVVDYRAGIPLNTPTGRAVFFVRETYACSSGIRILETGHVHFEVAPPKAVVRGLQNAPATAY